MTNRYLYTPVSAFPSNMVTLGTSPTIARDAGMLSLVKAFLELPWRPAFRARLSKK